MSYDKSHNYVTIDDKDLDFEIVPDTATGFNVETPDPKLSQVDLAEGPQTNDGTIETQANAVIV